MNCVITDDEPMALEILQDYISQVPGLILIKKCKNAMEALTVMRQQHVDILFMDIQMPGINGIEFLKSVKKLPAVILTTAFPQYALEGYDLDVVDYLLKPISFDRFLKAIDKMLVRSNTVLNQQNNDPLQKPWRNYFFIKSNQDLVKLLFSEILYVEGMENYVRIYCEKQTITTLATLAHIEKMLPPEHFIRVHRSYIVNLEKVNGLFNNTFKLGNKEINIGKSYRKNVLEVLRKVTK